MGAALGTLPFDEAVWQEHRLFRVKKLFNRFGGDQPLGLEFQIDFFGQSMVLRTIGGVPVVKCNVKAIEVLLSPCRDVGHKLLGGFANFFSRNHDGRAVGVIGADKVNGMTKHALSTHPNISLDVLHDVTNVKVSIGVGQGGGDEQLARGHV